MTTVDDGNTLPLPLPGIPRGWRRRRRVAHLQAAARALFSGRNQRFVRGAVLVLCVGDGSEFVTDLFRYRRRRRRPKSVAEVDDMTLWEIRCLPGAEAAVSDTINYAWRYYSSEARGSVETTRLPEVSYESIPAAPDRLAHALAQMNLAPVPASGTGAVVGVIDSDLREQLIPGLKVTRLYPSRRRIHVPYTLARDPKTYHGTAVTGLIASVAPGAEIVWLSKPADIEFWLPGLLGAARDHADGRPLVVNLSWVYELEALPENEQLRFLKAVDAILSRAMTECVIVAAAGNVRADAVASPMGYPARCPYVLAVAAATHDGEVAPESRKGKDDGPWCIAPAGLREGDSPEGLIVIRRKPFAGTSMASALVSGLVATAFGTRSALDMADHLDQLIVNDPTRFLRLAP